MTLVFCAVFLVVPPVSLSLFGKAPELRQLPWLVVACVAVAASWQLPNPFSTDYSSTLSQHAVGGGLTGACVAYYLIGHLGSRGAWHRLLLVLLTVSLMGVANELLELGLDIIRGTSLRLDASVDLAANTVGAIATWTVIELGGMATGRTPSNTRES